MRASKLVGIVFCGLGVLSAVACKTDKSQPASNTQTLAPLPAPQEQPAPQNSNPASQLGKNSCYQDLCQFSPENPDLKSIVEKAEKPSEKQKAYFDQHISPVLNSLMTAKMQEDQIGIERMQKIEDAGLKYNLSEEKMNLIKTMAVLSGKLVSSQERNNALAILNEENFMNAFSQSRIRGVETYFSQMYPNQNLEEAIKTESEASLKLILQLNKRMNSEIISIDETPFLIAKNKQPLSLEQIDKIVGISFGARAITKIMNSKELLKLVHLDNEIVREHYKKSKSLEKARLRLASTPQVAAKCEAAFYKAINLLPNEQQIENFKKIESEVKESVIALLPAGDTSLEKIKNAKAYYPQTPEKGIQNWINGLQLEIGSTRTGSENLKNLSEEDLYFVGMVSSLSNSESRSFCDEIIDMSISDSILTTEAIIKVSWLSVKYPQYGAMIYAHELGHTVQEHSQSFARKQQCLINKKGLKTYIGDDFADVFAAEAMASYQQKTNKPVMNLGCILHSEESAKGFTEDGSGDLKHSKGLYRILQVAQGQRKEIPQSCVEQAQREQPKALEVCN